MNYDTIKYEKSGAIGRITLNRPEKGNTINSIMEGELIDACRHLNQQDDLRVVIITGAGDRDFCCGEELEGLPNTIDGEEYPAWYPSLTAAVLGVEVPLIAAMNGNTLGIGLALALGCDIRILSQDAMVGVPDVAQGFRYASGITQLLPRIVGRGKALELILTATSIDASEAYHIGLVHKVAPHHEVLPEAEKLAQGIVSSAPIALKYAKESICKGLDLTLEQGLRLECDLYMILHTTADRTEGVRAFQQKRSPEFRGE